MSIDVWRPVQVALGFVCFVNNTRIEVLPQSVFSKSLWGIVIYSVANMDQYLLSDNIHYSIDRIQSEITPISAPLTACLSRTLFS